MILDQQIGPGQQAQEQCTPRLGGDITGDATLVGIVDEKEPALLGVTHIARKRSCRARRVTAGRLDLDHVSAIIGEQSGAERC